MAEASLLLVTIPTLLCQGYRSNQRSRVWWGSQRAVFRANDKPGD